MPRNIEAKRSVAAPTAPKGFSLISDSKLKQLYVAMTRCRLLDEYLRRLHRQTRSRYLSSAGGEAAIVGAAIDLRRQDWLIPQHSASIASLVKGVPLTTIFPKPESGRLNPSLATAEPIDKLGKSLNIVPQIPTLAAQLDIAVGLALAEQGRNKGDVVMIFCEAIPASSPRLRQSLQFAAERHLPLLILAQNARPHRSGSAQRKSRRIGLITEARASGIPVIPVDQTDVVAMYRVAFESIHKARHDGGPTVIEAAAWQPPTKQRAKDTDFATDPIVKMEAYLAGKGLFSDRWKQGLVNRSQKEIEAAMYASESKDA
jgi:TPP-dependent pyruvate/acetoin dehydrogenase alpha subunit